MSIFEAIFQGILQGIAEFLPISSSGHLSVFQYITGMQESAFVVLLHLGTLLAVFICYRKRIGKLIVEFIAMVKDIFKGKFSFKNMSYNRNFIWMVLLSLVPLLFFFFIKDPIQATSTDNNLYVEAFSFIGTSVLMFLAANAAKKNSQSREITWKIALAMGIMQGVASLPGVSRSGSTLAIALLLGLNKATAVEFSFIMGIPAVLGANLFEFIDLFKGETGDLELLPVVIGVVISAVVGILSIRLLNVLLKKDKFHIFGYYCLAIGLICLIISIAGSIVGHNIFA